MGPIVILGTKCPSITSTCIKSAPPSSSRLISLPNDVFLTLKDLHSYEVPEIQVVDVATGNLAYFNWMDEVLH